MTVLGKSELDFDYDEEENILFVTIHGRPAGRPRSHLRD